MYLQSRVQAAFSFGNLLSKLVTRRLAFISTPLLKEERAESGILSDNLSTVLQNSTDMTYVISMDESNGYSQYSLKCSPWISDSIWLALTFQCRSLLDGGDKALASVARCLGLLSMGLRLSNTAHEQCLMELFGALIDKILLRSGKKAKSPSNTHDEETVLTKATDIEQAAQCGIQTYSKKVTYSLAKSLSSVCTRLHTLDSSDQHGRPRALVIFGVLIRYGTTKIKQLACIGALSVCIVDIEKSNIAQKKVYFGEELLNLFENVIFTVCSPETSSWLRRGNTTYANTGEFERLLQFHSSLLRLLHVLLVVALQNRENSLDSTNVDTGSRFVDIVAHHSMELTDSLVTLTTWIAADRDMFTAILAEIESFVGCICEGLVSLSKPPSVSESSIGLNSGGGEVFVDESLFAFDHSVLLDQRLTESSETSIPFRVVAQWRSIAQSIRLSSASTTSTRESQIQGLSLTVHPIPNKNVAQSATDEFDSDNDEGDEF